MTAAAPGHLLILASAGTGKTFRLTSRFLSLLAREVPPERILGTTFTRTAAGEILDRILERLAKAARDPGELATLVAHLEGARLDAAGCVALLGRLVRSIDRFHIETLDAFFLRVAQVLAHELGLPPGWRLIDDAEEAELRADAVARLLEDADPGEVLALLRSLQRGGEGRSIHEALLRLVGQGQDIARQCTPGAWEALALPAPLGDDELAALLEDLEQQPVPLTKKNEPHQTWVKAVRTLVAAAREEGWVQVVEKSLGAALEEGIFAKHPFPPALADAVGRLVRHGAAVLLAQKASEARHWRQLLGRFEVAYAALECERGRYRFDDLPRLLAGEGAPPLPPWRLGGAIDHLLLDEFQDTSVHQWGVLDGLARRIVRDRSQRRSFFCVGDVKQSIFGWRGGEPRLLAEMPARLGELQTEGMEHSRRSAPIVLETVNSVFGRLTELPLLQVDDAYRAAARHWQERWRPHTTAVGALPGAAAVMHEVDAGAGNTAARSQRVLDAAARHVRRLVDSQPGWTVGVLVRKRERIAPLIYELRQVGLRASDQGGNPLVDSDAVLTALSLLHLADHPGDTMAFFHVATSPLGAVLGVSLGDREADERSARELSARVRADLLERGYGPVLGDLFAAMGEGDGFSDWDRSRFAQLVDAAYAWEARASLRPGDFVRAVRLTKVEDPSRSAVAVMTVHASKGLEFDAVVLPDLDNPLEPTARDDPLMWRRSDPAGPIELVFPRCSRALAQKVPELLALQQEGRQRRIEEELCVLYVALTRAKRRLDLLVPDLAGSRYHRQHSTLLRQALGVGEADGAGVLWRAEGGEDSVGVGVVGTTGSGAAPASASAAATATESVSAAASAADTTTGSVTGAHADTSQLASELLHLPPPRSPRSWRRRSPSSLEGGRTLTAHQLLRPRPSDSFARGLVIHRWFAEVEWLETFRATDEQLLALAREVLVERGHAIDVAALSGWLADFRRYVAAPRLSALLSQGSAAPLPRDSRHRAPVGAVQGELFGPPRSKPPAVPRADTYREVWRERPFAVSLPDATGAPVLVTGSFDRVVLTQQGDRPTAAEILDFKTDVVKGSVPKSVIERYRPQMQEYRRVLAALTGLEPAAITLTLAFVAADTTESV